jgi:hypothetical protein
MSVYRSAEPKMKNAGETKKLQNPKGVTDRRWDNRNARSANTKSKVHTVEAVESVTPQAPLLRQQRQVAEAINKLHE